MMVVPVNEVDAIVLAHTNIARQGQVKQIAFAVSGQSQSCFLVAFRSSSGTLKPPSNQGD